MDVALLLGKTIRMRRKAASISQERLADLSGLDRSYLGRIERGEVNITVASLYQIAQALHCHPAELLPDNMTCSDFD